MDYVYLFIHIPKTAGQTLRDHFIRNLNFHQTFIHLGPFGIEDAERRGLVPFELRSEEERDRTEVILGHGVNQHTCKLVPNKTGRHIVFLRDPAEQLVSLYNFTMEYECIRKGRPIVSFDRWWRVKRIHTAIPWLCREYLGMNITRDFSNAIAERVMSLLESFWFVGTLETFEQDTTYLLQEIGLPGLSGTAPSNVSGIHFEPIIRINNDIRAQIHSECSFDANLHRHFLNKRRAEIG